MFFKRFFLPLFLIEIAVLAFVSLCFGWAFYTWNAIWPNWTRIVIPFLLSLLFLILCSPFIKKFTDLEYTPASRLISPFWSMTIGLSIITIILMGPVIDSLRYNLGKVLTISSIQELKPNEQPAFLQVDDWYVDKMRVIPIKTIHSGSFLGFGKPTVNLLLIVPIFSNSNAYRSHAKAWLAFEYSEHFSKKEIKEGADETFLQNSLIHFKRLNIREFRYLEAYPRNSNYEAFLKMAQIHDYFTSGYGNVYLGQYVDRDILSGYLMRYFLFLFAIAGIPLLVILSSILYIWQKKSLKINALSDEELTIY